MKKTITLITLLLIFSVALFAGKSTIIRDLLREQASLKVENIQSIVRFDNTKEKQLVDIEYNYLLDVLKAEHGCSWNSLRKVEKLKLKKEKQLQKVLTRAEFIKYDAIEKQKIQMHPLRLR